MDKSREFTAERLANKLDGCTDISKDDALLARDNGLVIVYGYSDNNIELEGAIREEIGAYDGGEVLFAKGDVLLDCDNPCEHCANEDLKNIAQKITAHWNKDGYSWVMEADDSINEFLFDMRESNDDDTYFCKGLVFNIKDIA